MTKRKCEWCQEVKEPYGYQEGEDEKTGDVKALWICNDCYHAIFEGCE